MNQKDAMETEIMRQAVKSLAQIATLDQLHRMYAGYEAGSRLETVSLKKKRGRPRLAVLGPPKVVQLPKGS